MAKRDVRLIVCIDFEDVETLEEAYGKLVEGMNTSAFKECWESSDEYYDSSQDEEPGDETLLSKARVRYWDSVQNQTK